MVENEGGVRNVIGGGAEVRLLAPPRDDKRFGNVPRLVPEPVALLNPSGLPPPSWAAARRNLSRSLRDGGIVVERLALSPLPYREGSVAGADTVACSCGGGSIVPCSPGIDVL